MNTMSRVRAFMNKEGFFSFVSLYISFFACFMMCLFAYAFTAQYLLSPLQESFWIADMPNWHGYCLLVIGIVSAFTATYLLDSFLKEREEKRSMLSVLGSILTSLLAFFIFACSGMLFLLVILKSAGMEMGRVAIITVGCISTCAALVFTVCFLAHLLGIDTRFSVEKKGEA